MNIGLLVLLGGVLLAGALIAYIAIRDSEHQK